jgi:hypothetical protein
MSYASKAVYLDMRIRLLMEQQNLDFREPSHV